MNALPFPVRRNAPVGETIAARQSQCREVAKGMRLKSRAAIAASAAVAALVLGKFSRAGSITWGSPTGGDFTVGTNWAGGVAPSTGSDWAYFSNNTLDTGAITMGSNTSIEGMTLNNTTPGTLTFNLGATTTYSLSLYLIMGDNTTTPLENPNLDLTSGTMSIASLALIGNDPNSTGTVVVTGPNSVFNAGGSIRIGSDGGNNSTMTLSDGAQSSSAALWVGLQTATGCVLTVTDPGTKMSISGAAQVAAANEGLTVGGDDQINVLNGGELDLGQLLVGVGDTTAVDNESVTISGANSVMKVSANGGSSSTAVYLGFHYSDNQMSIQNGAQFTATHGDFAIGSGAGSTGNVLSVTSGGTFTLTGTGLISGQGRLNVESGTFILNGGTATIPGLLANSSTSVVQLDSGTAIVGNASVSNGSPLLLGDGGSSTATYEMSNPSGTHTFANGLLIQSNGVLTGAATITGNVNNNGAVAVGSGSSTGTIGLVGNYAQSSAGTLDIGLDGVTPSTQYDVLSITGTASLSGSLDVTLNSFVPSGNESFDILQSGGLGGTEFSSVILPSVPGETLNVTYTPTDVILNAAPVPEPTTLGLLALGGVLFLRRRSCRQASFTG